MVDQAGGNCSSLIMVVAFGFALLFDKLLPTTLVLLIPGNCIFGRCGEGVDGA